MRSRKWRIFNKVLAVILVLGLNLGAFDGAIRLVAQEWQLTDFRGFVQSAFAGSPKGEKNKNTLPPTAKKKEHKDPKAEEAKLKHEVKDKRTLNSKTYQIGENKFKEEVYLTPIHYENANKELVDIDNTLVEEKAKGFDYVNKANSMKVRFAQNAQEQKLGQVEYKGTTFGWNFLEGKKVKGNVISNTITYEDIAKNTNLRYSMLSNTLKEEIILTNQDTPDKFEFGMDISRLNYKVVEDGIEFFDPSTKEVIWFLPKPFMVDAKGQRSENVTAEISEQKGQWILTVTPDAEWLNSSDRQFPVVIDPTVDLQPGSIDGRDTYVSQKEPERNFRAGDNLYVDGTTGSLKRTFLHFNLAKPKTKVNVTSATFSIYGNNGDLNAATIAPVKFNWDWNGSTLDWNYYQKYSGSIGAVQDTVSGPNYGWWDFNVQTMVEGWLNSSSTNYGMMLAGSGAGDMAFNSCDAKSLHPKLTYTYVAYTPPKEDDQDFVAPDFTLHVDKKTGTVKADGTSMKSAKIYLAANDGQTFETTADEAGKWSITLGSIKTGITKTLTMKYEYDYELEQLDPVTGIIKKVKKTYKSDSIDKDFLLTIYSKEARLKKLAKFYYYDGTQDVVLKEDNEVENELDLVVGDYILVMDPMRSEDYTTGTIVKNPDAEYKLREKLKPIYANGEVIGNSVDAATGNFFSMETDLDYDAIGFPVEFSRTLNSQQSEMIRGPLGLNWALGYNRMLVMYGDGSIEVTGGDGGGNFFSPTGDGVNYSSFSADVTDRLVKNSDGTYTLTTEDDTQYQFNEEGMLVTITDCNSNQLTLNYDPEGLLDAVVDASGRVTTLIYDDEGRVWFIIDPEDRQVEYNYDDLGRLSTITDPEGGVTTYTYEGYKIDTITDAENNVVVDNTYDSLGRVLAQSDAAGYGTSFNYEANQTNFRDENGKDFTYSFDAQYRIKEINGPVTTDGQTAGVTAQSYRKASVDTSGTLVHYEYDARGNRIKVVDALGHATKYTYDGANNLKTVTDPLGNVTKYSYDGHNNLDQVIDANEKLTSMVYDSKGNLRSTTNPLLETTTYEYYDNGQAKKVIDAAGKTIEYNYDLYGNVKTTVDGNKNITTYEYDGIGRNKQITDAKGYITTFEYDNNGNLLKENSSAGSTINTYDKNGNLTGTQDPEGYVTTYKYDSRNNMVQVKNPLLYDTNITYNKKGYKATVTDAEGKITKYEYNVLGKMKKIIDPAGDVFEYIYDKNGNRIGEMNANGQYTKYEFDSLNRINAVIDPLQQKIEYTYDAVGNNLTYKNINGIVTEYKYDSLGRMIEFNALNRSTKFTYDASGNQQTVTDAMGKTYSFYYDGNNNLVKVINHLGEITEYKYDVNNNQIEIKDSLGNITSYEYDKQNRLISVIDPLNRGTKFELDSNGNRTKFTDGNGNTTHYEYDALGLLRYVIDPKNNRTEYKYDKDGNLLQFIDANKNVTRYEYNLKNLLTKQINSLDQITKYEYDKHGNITAKIDAKGQRIEYVYDQINRLLGTYYPDGKYVEYGYNKQGEREWMEDNYGTSWYDYDTLGRLTAVTNQDDMTTEYEYNTLGKKTKVVYPDGKDVKYDYDQSNRLIKVTDRLGKITTYDYDSLSRRTKTTLPNGIVTTYDYDKANQLKAIASTNKQQKLLAKYEYEYDAAGNRVNITETAEDQTYTSKYTYDPLNQLEEVLNPDGTKVKYQYDQVGNRTKMFNIAGTTLNTTNYFYDSANQLTKTNVNDGELIQYKYDANGNRVAKITPDNVVTKYTWDYENRLTNVQMHQGKFVDYEYDGDGNRISKIAGVKQPLMKETPNQGKVNKQQADLIYNAANNDNGIGNDGNNGNAGGNGNGNGNDGDNGNAGGNGNGKGNDKDDPDGDKSGNGNGKGKGNGNGKDLDKVKNKDLTKEERNNKKENAKQGKGYRQKGKNTNRGKHLGWYKDKNKDKLEQQIEETYYLNDVSQDLEQVMMTYNDSGNFDTAYTYGVERIGIDILDGTRPDAQNPLYYLYDGQGSVTYVTKPDGEKRDTLTYDEFGKPRTGKLSPDGDKILNSSYGYTGEIWDEENNLLYLRARYYEPEIGRFLSRDYYGGKNENPLSKHLYAYVENNPINYIDPYGLYRTSLLNIRQLGYYRAYYDKSEKAQAIIDTFKFIPVVGDAVGIGEKIYDGDEKALIKEVLTSVATIGIGKAFVYVAKIGGGTLKRLEEFLLDNGPSITYNGVSYMLQTRKKANRDTIIFGIYKYMFGHASMNKNGLWIEPVYSAKKYYKSRLKEIDSSVQDYDDNYLIIQHSNERRGVKMAYAYFDTIDNLLSGNLFDIEIPEWK